MSYYCNCLNCYKGEHCEIDSCTDVDCGENGYCEHYYDCSGTFCKCRDNFHGENCESVTDVCVGLTAGACNNGYCIEDNASEKGYSCSCVPCFKGEFCDIPVNYCADNSIDCNCVQTSDCRDYICSCGPNKTGKNCEVTINKCSDETNASICQNGECVLNEKNEEICVCPGCYKGRFCETRVDVCSEVIQAGYCNSGECIPGFESCHFWVIFWQFFVI